MINRRSALGFLGVMLPSVAFAKDSVFYPSPEKEIVTETVEVEKQYLILNPSYEEPELRKMVGYTLKGCLPCGPAKARLGSQLIEWRDGPQKGCPVYPAVYDFPTKSYYYGSNLRSLETLRAAIQRTEEKMNLPPRYEGYERVFAEVDKSILEMVRFYLGNSGKFDRNGPLEPINYSIFQLRFPNNLAGHWSTSNGETTLKFTERPILRVRVLDQAISGFVLTDTSIRLNIDWFPDITLQAEGIPYSSPSPRKRWAYPNSTAKDWLAAGNLGEHLVLGHGQPRDKVSDLTEDERYGLHSDCHHNRVQPFFLVNLSLEDWS